MHFENKFVIIFWYTYLHDYINRAMSSILTKWKNTSEAQSIECLPHNCCSFVFNVFTHLGTQKQITERLIISTICFLTLKKYLLLEEVLISITNYLTKENEGHRQWYSLSKILIKA